MQNLIEHLRQRPASHRHAVALGISFLVTLIIAGIWATTFFPVTSNKTAQAQSGSTGAEQNSFDPSKQTYAQGPISTFNRNIAQSITALKAQMSSLGSFFTETKYEAQPTLQVVNPSENAAGTDQNSAANSSGSVVSY